MTLLMHLIQNGRICINQYVNARRSLAALGMTGYTRDNGLRSEFPRHPEHRERSPEEDLLKHHIKRF